MTEELNYEEDLRIDPNALDVEWLDQPMLFCKYAEQASVARAKVDKAKEKLDAVRAVLDKDIRANPERHGLPKITEGAISSTILVHNDYEEAAKSFIEAKHEADLLVNAVRAFDQRKTALENLVRLYGQQYFAGPTEPRDLDLEYGKKAIQRQARSKVKEGSQRRRGK